MTQSATNSISYPSLDSRISVFRHDGIVDTFAVLTERFLVLVDTATRPEAIETVLTLLDSHVPGRSLLVINTHGDWDHVWGNSVFRDRPAPILAHRRAVPRMLGPDAERLLTSTMEAHPGLYDRVRLTPPSLTFDRLEIDGGDLTLCLIPTPGHTSDHLAVWIPEIRCLLAGDAAESPFPLVSEDGSLSDLRSSLRVMQELSPETVLYCHAPGRIDPDVLSENLSYFDRLEERCRAAGPGTPPHDVDWPLEDALLPGMVLAEVPDVAFYRRFHQANIEAGMRQWGSDS